MNANQKEKLLKMTTKELKEIVHNSFLYDEEIVNKAKELLSVKDNVPTQTVESAPKTEKTSSKPRNKGLLIASISVIVVLIAAVAILFGVRANNAEEYILVKQTDTNGFVYTYEYEFNIFNNVTKQMQYSEDNSEPCTTIYFNNKGQEVKKETDYGETTEYLYDKGINNKQIIYDEDNNIIGTFELVENAGEVLTWLQKGFDDDDIKIYEKYNEHGDMIWTQFGENTAPQELEYVYDEHGNKIKSSSKHIAYQDTEINYTYMTIKEYKSRTTEKETTVKGNIEFRDYNGKVLLTKEDVKKAVAITENDTSYVEITFTASGKEKFTSATEQISTLSDGQNIIGIYLNDECISAPTVNERLVTNTVNIAPLTSEDATNIANAINDGNYTNGYTTYASNEANDFSSSESSNTNETQNETSDEEVIDVELENEISNLEAKIEGSKNRITLFENKIQELNNLIAEHERTIQQLQNSGDEYQQSQVGTYVQYQENCRRQIEDNKAYIKMENNNLSKYNKELQELKAKR